MFNLPIGGRNGSQAAKDFWNTGTTQVELSMVSISSGWLGFLLLVLSCLVLVHLGPGALQNCETYDQEDHMMLSAACSLFVS